MHWTDTVEAVNAQTSVWLGVIVFFYKRCSTSLSYSDKHFEQSGRERNQDDW